MKKKARIAVDATPAQKALLEAVLHESGTTITDWFNTKLEEAVAMYGSRSLPSIGELTTLTELTESEDVFATLAAIDWAFATEETAYLSHDIHPYPAKFIPQIPQYLIKQLSLRGEMVWDPFGGSGTTALEAILLGRSAISTDLNPLAAVIGRAKTLTLTKEEEDTISDFVEEFQVLSASAVTVSDVLEQSRDDIADFVPAIPNITEWFHPQAVKELAYLRWRITAWQCTKGQTLAWVCFSKVVLNASFQDSETRYTRRPHDVAPGSVFRHFASGLSSALSKVRYLSPLLRFREAEFKTLDLRGDTDAALPANSVDLVVTSPPYANANDYHLYHRFRLFWLGYDPRDLAKSEIGSHLRHQKERTGFDSYLDEMTACLRHIHAALRPGRYAVLVVGDAVFEGKVFKAAEQLGDAARQVGFEVVGIIDRPIHATKRSFIAAARRARTEQMLVLRKGAANTLMSLGRPPYRLWEYEKTLRRREIEVLTGRAPEGDADSDYAVSLHPLSLDRLRRLTFTHTFASPSIHRELTWQAVLENGDVKESLSNRKDPKYATHGIHAYKGKFYPQLAKSLFNLAGLEPGQKILDPFCGSGTVLLEAYLNGFQSIGLDLNPLAVKIARVKTDILEVDPYLRTRLLSRFAERLPQMESGPEWLSTFSADLHAELLAWFPKPVLCKLGWLLHEVAQVPDSRVREYLEVLVSSIVRDVSQQDPRDLRIRRRAHPLEDAPVAEMFEDRLREQQQRLLHFAERSKKAPCAFAQAQAFEADGRLESTYLENGIPAGSVDAVVTSPPYATALPYIDTDRLSLLLLFGLRSAQRSPLEVSLIGSREIGTKAKSSIDEQIDASDFGQISSPTARRMITEIRQRNVASNGGFRRQNMAALLYRYVDDMSRVMTHLNRVLAPGASAFIVIGDNQTEAGGEKIPITTSQVLQEIACDLGWALADVIPITVTKESRPHSKHSITENDILWFRKR